MAVAEKSRSRGKGQTSGSLLATVLLGALTSGGALAASPPFAMLPTTLPTGAQVTAGQAQIGQAGNTLTVTQGSSKAAINWQSFSIGKDATVNFVQPNASAVVLNRVTGAEGSVIDGALKANGQVFVLNPNGVLFGQGARVDTAGLVASTLGLSDADFLAGKLRFAGDGARGASVVNQGQLTAHEGGYVALLGQQVRNDGVISARLGTVALAAGNKLSLNFNGDALVGVTLEEGALEALVANGGAVRADGGLVLLTAKAADGLLNAVVNNSGEIRAQTVAERGGKIYLLADMQGGSVQVGGTLDASAPQGATGLNGGFIETSGAHVQVKDDVAISTRAATDSSGKTGKTGTWLIDPTDFNIVAGSAALSNSGIGASTLASSLANTDVTIQTQASGSEAGNINVNSALAWGANKLTLEAHGDININAVMSLTGTSTLDLKAGYDGSVYDSSKFVRTARNADGSFSGRVDIDRSGTGILSINGEGYTLINSMGLGASSTGTDLQGISGNLSGRYALATNLDASGWNGGGDFNSLGSSGINFTGSFNGLGHSISGLKSNRGLFSFAGPAVDGTSQAVQNSISNLALTTASVTGSTSVGLLVGSSQMGALGSVRNVYVSGSVHGGSNSGGLIGTLGAGSVLESSATVAVDGLSAVGGLIGTLGSGGAVKSSSASGDVSGRQNVGGLIGSMSGSGSSVDKSYATGTVAAASNFYAGGLIGVMSNGSVTESYATGNVSGRGRQGGLVGSLSGGALLSNVYATGAVSGPSPGGGLVGYATVGSISNAYATGAVSGTGSYLAGFIGQMSTATTVTYSFWDTTSSGLSTAYYNNSGVAVGSTTGIIEGLGTTAMKTLSTFTGAGWNIVGADGVYPTLNLGRSATIWSMLPPITSLNYTLSALSGTYNGGAFSLASLWAPSVIFASCTACQSWTAGTDYTFQFGGNAVTGFTNAGSYTNLSIALSSAQTAYYAIAGSGNTAGSLTIAPRSVSLAAVGSRVYDASTIASASLLSVGNIVNGDTVGLSGSAVLASKDVGSRAVTSISGLSLDNTNYTLSGVTATGTVSITARPVTVTVNNGAVKVYDGSTALANTLLNLGNVINGDSVTLSGSGALASKDAGTRALTGAGSLALDNSNYTMVGSTLSGSATVTPRSVDIAILNSATRVYDGTTGLEASLLSTGNIVSGDTLNLSGSAVLAGKDVGSHTLTGLGSLATDNANYTLVGGGLNGAVAVSARPVTVTTSNGASKVYDGSTALASTLLNLGNVINGDSVTLSGAGVLASKDAGTRALTGAGSLALDNSNYTMVGSTLSGSAMVTPRSVDIAAVSGATRVYDGTAAVAASLLSMGNVVNGDTVSLSGSAVLASKDVGSRAVTSISGLSLDNTNYTLSGVTATGTFGVTARPVTVITNNSAQKVYDGSTALASNLLNLGNVINGDSVTLSGAGVLASKDAGTRALTGAGSLALDNSNYTMVGSTLSGNATVTPRSVDIAAVSGASRVYDGTTGLDASLLSMSNVVSGDTVSLSGSALLASKDVGSRAITNISGLSLDNANYTLSGVTATGNVGVTARPVTVTVSNGASKVYDGSTALASNLLNLGNVINGDSVTLSGAGVLASKDVGTRALAGVGSLALDNSNYTMFGATVGGSALVSARLVDIAAVSGASRVYDGTTGLDASLLQIGNVVSGDTVSLSGSAVLASKAVGSRAVTSNSGLSLDNANYTLSGVTATGTVGVTARPVTVTANSGASKVYDGSTVLTSSLLSLGNLVGGDNVTLSGSGLLASKDAGTRALTGAGSLALDNSNYTMVGSTLSGSAAVTPRSVDIATVNGASRVYDGTAAVAASLLSMSNVVSGDTVSLSGSAVLASKDVGSRAITNISGLSLDNANYTLSGVTAAGNVGVTARPVTVTVSNGASKVYDGSTALASNLLNLGNLVSGDSVTLSGSGVLASKDAGTRTLTGIGSLALDNSNYTMVGATVGGSAVVSARAVDIAAVGGATRVYDGTTGLDASLLSVGNVVSGDRVTLSGSATVASKDAGNRAVSGPGSLRIDNANYTLVGGGLSGAVAISPRVVQLASVGGATRVYDGGTAVAAGLLRIDNVIAGDLVGLSGVAGLASKNVGTQAVSSLTGLSIDNGNYTLAGATTTATVAITPRSLNLNFSVADRVFDGSSAAAASVSDNRVAGDQLSVAFGSAYVNPTAANAKPVLISGLALTGGDAGNYVMANGSGSGVTGNVSARPISYTLALLDPASIYTATGQTLFTAATLDQLVTASVANTVPGFGAGSISYTIWRNGEQVAQVAEAGRYELRATLTPANGNYLLPTNTASVGLQVAAPTLIDTAQAYRQTEIARSEIPSTLALVAPDQAIGFNPAPSTVLTPLPSLALTFGEGAAMRLVSAPASGENTQPVNLTQARLMLGTPGDNSGAERDVRVPVSRNSLVEIVNGGLRLPGGVDQLLFAVADAGDRSTQKAPAPVNGATPKSGPAE